MTGPMADLGSAWELSRSGVKRVNEVDALSPVRSATDATPSLDGSRHAAATHAVALTEAFVHRPTVDRADYIGNPPASGVLDA